VLTSTINPIGAHELGHNDLIYPGGDLLHPRQVLIKNDEITFVTFRPEVSFPLAKEVDDRKRLMWPLPQKGVEFFPTLLIKDECDRLHGIDLQE